MNFSANLFREPLGRPAGLPDCPGLNGIVDALLFQWIAIMDQVHSGPKSLDQPPLKLQRSTFVVKRGPNTRFPVESSRRLEMPAICPFPDID